MTKMNSLHSSAKLIVPATFTQWLASLEHICRYSLQMITRCDLKMSRANVEPTCTLKDYDMIDAPQLCARGIRIRRCNYDFGEYKKGVGVF